MEISRVWSMPSRWTFTIKPIRELLDEEVKGDVWCDPFCGKNGSKYASFLNDIETSGVDALDFLSQFPDSSFIGVLYDPPYSITQARKYGRTKFASMKYWKDVKDQMARVIKPGGKAICFGWSSMGLGKGRGFEMQRILLVPHGGSKNDTLVTVEIKN